MIVTVGNLKPIAVAQFNHVGQLFTGDTITLDGSASYDPDGGNLTYRWTLIDRPEGSDALMENADTPTPDFIIDKQGDYIAQLIVNDGQTDSEPATVLIKGIQTCIQNLAIRPKYGEIQLTWTYNPDTLVVQIERSLNLNGPYEVIGQTDSTYATYLDDNLVNGTTYYYRLRGKFAGQTVYECYEIPDSPPVCGGQSCSWALGEGGQWQLDCGGQTCEIISSEPMTVQCKGGAAASGANSCPPEDDFCQYVCELYEQYGPCAPPCPMFYSAVSSEEDADTCGPCVTGEFPDFDLSQCEPPASNTGECATQVIASQPVGRVRITWVPDLSGMSVEQAQAALTQAQLLVGTITYERTTAVAAGQVIRQDVPRDSALPVNSAVNIVISTRGVTE
jgi:hypothetical protein